MVSDYSHKEGKYMKIAVIPYEVSLALLASTDFTRVGWVPSVPVPEFYRNAQFIGWLQREGSPRLYLYRKEV